VTAPRYDAEAHTRRARSFGAVAESYERWRPGYPDAAVDWLLPPDAREVADLGAGTGKLTGLLLARGLSVTAVEPDPAMLAVLGRVHPAAEAVAAGAGDLPLPDAAVDAVLVGQAWHWFPHQRAAAEVRRVLRPGGSLGLIWNQSAPGEPWQEEVERLNAGARGIPVDTMVELPGVIDVEGLPSDELEAALFPWTEHLTATALRSRLATYSHVALLERAEREQLLDAAAALVTEAAERRGTTTVPFRAVAYCVRWRPA
jgi:SAM-dependent methyltransferase